MTTRLLSPNDSGAFANQPFFSDMHGEELGGSGSDVDPTHATPQSLPGYLPCRSRYKRLRCYGRTRGRPARDEYRLHKTSVARLTINQSTRMCIGQSYAFWNECSIHLASDGRAALVVLFCSVNYTSLRRARWVRVSCELDVLTQETEYGCFPSTGLRVSALAACVPR